MTKAIKTNQFLNHIFKLRQKLTVILVNCYTHISGVRFGRFLCQQQTNWAS